MSHPLSKGATGSGQITIASLDDRPDAEWDAFVRGDANGSFFHLKGWKTAIEGSLGHRCHYLFAEADGRICGVLPLVHVKSRLFANALISTGFTVLGGPITTNDEARIALEREAVSLAERLDVAYLEFRLRQPRNLNWPRNDTLYFNFRKSLEPDFDRTMAAIPRRRRAAIRSGIKNGLVAETTADVSEFYPVFAESNRDHGTPVMHERFFRALSERFGDDCEITTVRHNGEIVASAMCFHFRDEMIPYYGGGTAVARQLAAHDFMYWDIMRRASENGCRVMDLGRSKRGTGAFKWKKLWGLEPEPLHYEFKLLRRDDVPAFNPTNPKYSHLVSLWRRLPLPVANRIGPMIARGLG